MIVKFIWRRPLVVGFIALFASGASSAEPFYKGKTIRFVISTGVAGGYAEYARSLATYLPGHIEGAPAIVVQSMPGAGGLLAGNHLYFQAAQDGTVLGLVHSTVPLAPLWGIAGARYDGLKFNWLGAMDREDGVCTLWHTSATKTWADMLARETLVGSQGVGSPTELYPQILNRIFGARIKIINGYHDGTDIDVAMQRGELEGRCGTHLATYKALHPDWFNENKLIMPIAVSEQRLAEFPDSSSVFEFVHDDETRQKLQLLMTTQYLDRPLLMPPNTPEERVAELKKAIDETTSDPAFLREMATKNLPVNPTRGAEMAQRLRKAYATPPQVIGSIRDLMGTAQ